MPVDEDSCNICEGDKSTSKNPIIFCDGKGCDMPVHKRCYRVQVVPKGEWFCQRCECKRKKKLYHILCCPTQTGAIRKTDIPDEYMHVVCAMWNKSIEHDTDEPYAVPESQLNTRKCYFCSKKQGLCIQCEEPDCPINFHVTCAINNSLITPAATVPPDYFVRCVQHEIQAKTTFKRPEENEDKEVKKRHTSPNLLFPEDQQSSDDDMGPKVSLKRAQTDDSDDDMGPSKKMIKSEEALSYRGRLDAKRKKSTFDIKSSSSIDRSSIITPPLPSSPATTAATIPPKQKLPNKTHLNNNNGNRPPPPVKKNSIIKGIDEIQNEMRVSNPRWSNNNGTPLQHPQPTTPNLVNTPFFENEATKGYRNGIDELSKLKEENKRLSDFKKGVSQVFQGLNVPIPGTDPANDIEQYVIQLQLLMKRVGIISKEESRQIHESIQKLLK